MQTIEIRLERSSLEEDFDIVAQQFDTDILFTMPALIRLEKLINNIDELKERFVVFAKVEAKRYYYYNGSCYLDPRLQVKLVEILDYTKEKLLDFDFIIEG